MKDINKNTHVNRGVDFLLNGRKRKQPKTFHILFNKMVCFLNWEVTIYSEFSLDFRKKK